MGLGQLAGVLAGANRRRDDIVREREARARQDEQDQIQRMTFQMMLEKNDVVPDSQRETIQSELPPVGTTGTPPRRAPQPVNTGIVDPSRYRSVGAVNGQSYSQDRGPRIAAQRAADRTARIEEALKRSQIDENVAQAWKAQHPEAPSPRNIDPLSEAGISARGKIDENAAASAARHRAPAKPKDARPLPSSAVEKIVGLDNMLSMADDVRSELTDAVKRRVNVTGRVGGVIPTPSWMKNAAGMGDKKGDQTGTDVRSLIGNLYATVAKERAGSALSAGEIRLLESYLPNENEDEGTGLVKVHRFIRTLKQMRENKLKGYRSYGYGGVMDDEAPAADQLEQLTDPETWLKHRRDP